ncbi:M16 family metallopeptidase [Merismopedia glauca]|uniref:Peptidase M16 n=1 Tax=Merismopedia glauca CCAP 1448/3 TaxID=1296344 RepID=A0A2T1C2G5_9CYAN|nr:pitrilysin family protein [Merismopedia glauca]PSB02313.1 peptidase M16 [Merismopedia glauca CCAP 1448/3]
MPVAVVKSISINTPQIQKLPNGLTVVAQSLPVEAVNLSLWVNVGSAQESDPINGMAHFLEHMVFKGTSRLERGEFESLVEARGGVTNAATSQDYTYYYITTAPKDFADLAPLQIDVALNASIPDRAFEKERLVVLEEIRRSQDNPRRRVYQQAMKVAFPSLPYHRCVLGPTSAIEQLQPQQMRDFHQTWYQPSQMTAVAVGNLPVQELLEIVTSGFHSYTSLTQALAVPEVTYPIEPAFDRTIRHEYIDETLQQARLVILWRVPGLMQLSQTYELDVLAAILGQGKMSRLFRDLREERKLVSHISATNVTQKLQGVFQISAQLPSENLAQVEEAIAQHIRQLQQQAATQKEIERVQTQVANRFIFGNETPSDRATLYGYYQSMLQDISPALEYPTTIQSLNTTDLQLAAQNYLSPEAYGVVIGKANCD